MSFIGATCTAPPKTGRWFTYMAMKRSNPTDVHASVPVPPSLKRRKLDWKAKIESSPPYHSFKHLVSGTFNFGVIGSTCTALPRPSPHAAPTACRQSPAPTCSGAN